VVSSRRSRVTITEIVAGDEPVPTPAADAPQITLPPDSDGEPDPIVDERRARKAKGKARRDRALADRRCSARLAGKEPANHVTVEAQAIKRRGLRDSLFGCSPKLRAKVLNSKALEATRKPLGVKPVSNLHAAAAIPSTSVPSAVDV
jgi:hypothetical protein